VELSDLEPTIWTELIAASRDKAHPWRVMALATLDGEGHPQARHVILREVLSDHRLVRFYTDSRSPKVDQIRCLDRGTLLMWNPQRGWQLRLMVKLTVDDSGPEVNARWKRLAQSPAAQDYLSPLPPGMPVPEPPSWGTSPNALEDGRSTTPADRSRATDVAVGALTAIERGHFAMVKAQVLTIDWLELHAQGHRRARWQQSQWKWVVP
jgi:pyridoxamine 5'-phosphate oxidase